MDFPFETKTKDGRKATVLGVMPNGRLAGFITNPGGEHILWIWNADGSFQYPEHASITLPLQIKPLTTYRMRNGGIAWTTGKTCNGWVFGMDAKSDVWRWRIVDGRSSAIKETAHDLIEELPPGTTA